MNDEQQIRDLVTRWMRASKDGDVDTVLSMMSDDAVFLRPGHEPMRKSEFERTSRAQATGGPKFDGTSEVREIQICGDFAYMWSQLSVAVQLPDGEQ